MKTYSTITRCHIASTTIYQVDVLETTEDGGSSVLVEINRPMLGDNPVPRHVMLGIAQAARAWLERREAGRVASIEAGAGAELDAIVGGGK